MSQYDYETPNHRERIEELFPGGISDFSKETKKGLFVKFSEGEHENKGGLEISLLYNISLLPNEITERLSPMLKTLNACRIGIFFNKDDVIISSIQGQSFSDRIGKIFLTFNINTKKVRSIEDIQELTNDFVKIQSAVQETLIKKLGIPPHDFLFLLSSLVGVALGGKTIKFIKKEYSRSIYHKQTESRDKKLKIKFPQLQEGEKYVYRDKKQIIDHIASLPEKQQDMLFSSFDSLQEFRNRKNDQPIQDLSSTTKAELIGAIKANRKRSK